MKTSNITEHETCLNRNHFLFKHLSNEEFELISEQKQVTQHKRGSLLYKEGNRTNGFYCIEQGIIKVFKTGLDGKEQIILFAKKGHIIGYRSVLSKETACTSAQVTEDAITSFIPGEILVQLVKNNGNFSLELTQLICKELGYANSYITDIAQRTVRERLAEILIHLKEEFGLDKDQTLQIALTREELANIVGTATESVIRLLSEFKQDKLIEINGRKIILINENALKKIAHLF